ncbi:MAG: transporter substrate-binding domain-containing protein, partial [Hungatella sp.]
EEIAMDVIVAGYQIEQRKSDLIIMDETLASHKYGIGFKLGNDALKDRVQKTLEEMAADGTMKAVSEKWFGVDVTTIGK